VNVQHVSIERANLGRVDGIMKLAEEHYSERGGELTGHLDRETVAATMQKLPSIVACRGEQVVGFLLTWEKHSSGNPCVRAMLQAYSGSPDAYVYGPICVDASVRGLGIAGKMFEELRRLLPHREGILFIKASNESSLRAHQKMGMRETARYNFEDKQFIVFAYR
jgi:ribosomal protein S18 acetylase RimI-like enzyme